MIVHRPLSSNRNYPVPTTVHCSTEFWRQKVAFETMLFSGQFDAMYE